MRRLRHRRPGQAPGPKSRHPESQCVAAWPTSDGPPLALAGVGRCGRWDAAKQASDPARRCRRRREPPQEPSQAELFLRDGGRRLEDATKAEIEDFLADLLTRRSDGISTVDARPWCRASWAMSIALVGTGVSPCRAWRPVGTSTPSAGTSAP